MEGGLLNPMFRPELAEFTTMNEPDNRLWSTPFARNYPKSVARNLEDRFA